jgi:hypothetical protein
MTDNRVFYDWTARSWRLLPRPMDNAEEVFNGWLDSMEEDGDISSLEGIK